MSGINAENSSVLDLIKFPNSLLRATTNNDISVGLIDGPVDIDHPCFENSRIKLVNPSEITMCRNADSVACSHGTMVLGILTGARDFDTISVCPNCEILLKPLFLHNPKETNSSQVTPEVLANAIIETIEAGAKIINLSLAINHSHFVKYSALYEAYDFALQRDVLIVIAAGNYGSMGYNSTIDHQWVIPIASCDNKGNLLSDSNFNRSVNLQGFMAPGNNIKSTAPNGKYSFISGSSASVAVVTGAISMLWSQFPQIRAYDIRYCLRKMSSSNRTIIPKIFNVQKLGENLIQMH